MPNPNFYYKRIGCDLCPAQAEYKISEQDLCEYHYTKMVKVN